MVTGVRKHPHYIKLLVPVEVPFPLLCVYDTSVDESIELWFLTTHLILFLQSDVLADDVLFL